MGMFDVIYFDKPVNCNVCGRPIDHTQTKMFDCSMMDYEICDYVNTTVAGYIERSFIFDEILFCKNYSTDERHKHSEQLVYFVLFKNIIAFMSEEEDKADDIYDELLKLSAAQIDYMKSCAITATNYKRNYSRIENSIKHLTNFLSEGKEFVTRFILNPNSISPFNKITYVDFIKGLDIWFKELIQSLVVSKSSFFYPNCPNLTKCSKEIKNIFSKMEMRYITYKNLFESYLKLLNEIHEIYNKNGLTYMLNHIHELKLEFINENN